MIQRLLEIANAPNLTGLLSDDQLNKLGRKVVEEYERDEASRSEWKKRSEKAMEMALQVAQEKTFPWPGAANIKLPLLTVAALQFHSRAYPAVVQNGQIVKGKVTGEDPQNVKTDRAERIAKHMNYQLTEQMGEWDEQMDALLLALPIEGCEFKKTYYCSMKGRNVSEWVRPEHFVVHYGTKSLADCPRMTHIIEMYPHQIYEKVRSNVYAEAELGIATDEQDEEKPQEILEQHRLEDLDGDGIKEPYIVTVHKDSQKVLRIKARWEPTGIIVSDGQETFPAFVQEGVQPVPHERLMPYLQMGMAESPTLVKVEGQQYFTKYSFIPSPDGGFYDLGFGQLIGPMSEAADSIVNRLLDAGTLANVPMGFMSEGLKMAKEAQGTGTVRFKPGEFKKIKAVSAGSIADQIYQFKFPEPSVVLFQLLGLVVEQISNITAVKDVMTGQSEGQNTPVGTTMALIEQGLKVFSAIYKRIYRALGHELRRIYALNSVYLPPKEYFRVVDSPMPLEIQILDYQGDGTDVQPVADPSVATTMQRMAKAQFAMSVAQGNPHINGAEATRLMLEAGELPIDRLFIEEPPAPPPDPKMIELEAKLAKMGAETEKIRAETARTYSDIQATVAELQQGFEKLDIEKFTALVGVIEKAITQDENMKNLKEIGNDAGGMGPLETVQRNAGILPGGPLAGAVVPGATPVGEDF